MFPAVVFHHTTSFHHVTSSHHVTSHPPTISPHIMSPPTCLLPPCHLLTMSPPTMSTSSPCHLPHVTSHITSSPCHLPHVSSHHVTSSSCHLPHVSSHHVTSCRYQNSPDLRLNWLQHMAEKHNSVRPISPLVCWHVCVVCFML